MYGEIAAMPGRFKLLVTPTLTCLECTAMEAFISYGDENVYKTLIYIISTCETLLFL